MLTKIISGGQTGADQGGLEAGKELGLQTGGTAPWNWMTEDGPQEDHLKSLGLEPGPWDPRTYPKRTALNVKNSDGTVIFGNIDSAGCRLTRRYCSALYSKPVIFNPTPEALANFIQRHTILTLNVAGNREHTNPGIKERTKGIIKEAVDLLRCGHLND